MTKIDAFMNAIYAHAGISVDDVDLTKVEVIVTFCPRDMYGTDKGVCPAKTYAECRACWERPVYD